MLHARSEKSDRLDALEFGEVDDAGEGVEATAGLWASEVLERERLNTGGIGEAATCDSTG